MRQPEMTPVDVNNLEPAPAKWEWRRLRCFGVKLGIWSWPWQLRVGRLDDYAGGSIALSVGPFDIEFHYNDGRESR